MNDKEKSLSFWKEIGGYFPMSQQKDVLFSLTKAISCLPDNCIVLDIGGGNFSEYSSSRTIYNLLKDRSLNFELHIADIKSAISEIPENVFFHEGDLDNFFSDFNINRINLATAINIIQEPFDYKRILTSLMQHQEKGDIIFIMTPIYFNGRDKTNILLESLMKGYEVKTFQEGELEEMLIPYRIESKILEFKNEGHPELTKEIIEKNTGIEKAKRLIKKLKTENPKLQEMIDSHLSALNDGTNPVVNYGNSQLITAIKI